MALTPIEQVVLWGPGIVMLLVTFGYYLRWGKEADERGDNTRQSTSGGDR